MRASDYAKFEKCTSRACHVLIEKTSDRSALQHISGRCWKCYSFWKSDLKTQVQCAGGLILLIVLFLVIGQICNPIPVTP